MIIRTRDEKQINTHTHTLRKNRDVQTTRITNDTRRMALELELAGNAVQHTPAASSLYRAVSSALAPSIGQARQTHLVFRRNFYYTSKHKHNIVYYNNIYYCACVCTFIQHARILWPRRMCENRQFCAPLCTCIIIVIILIMVGNNKNIVIAVIYYYATHKIDRLPRGLRLKILSYRYIPIFGKPSGGGGVI